MTPITEGDAHLVGGILVAQLVASICRAVWPGIQLWAMEAFIKPTLVFLGRHIYRRADDAVGGRLPDFLRGDSKS